MPDVAPRPVAFAEAIEHVRQKVRLPTRHWADLWQGMHARAFVVAGATKAALIEDFHEAITRAIEEGRTLADFRKDFDRIVARHGWSYRGSRGWRSRVIFDTNLRMAHASGRWAQVQRLKARRPFLRYVAVLDSRTRPDHRDWHGTVLPVDDDWWRTHFPPNGWRCRCTVQSLSRRDLDRYGYQVSDQAPPVRMVQRRVNTPDGPVTIEVPEGLDPGFAYNVGEAAWGRGAQSLALERHGPWEKLEAPGGSRPAAPPPLVPRTPRAGLGRRAPAGDADQVRALFREALGGDEAVLADPAGERVLVGQALVDHLLTREGGPQGREAFFPLIRELVEDPDEVWVGFARSAESGRVSLRRRYVRLIRIDKTRTLGLVADSDRGMWSGWTFFRGTVSGLKNLRTGLRVYVRGEE